MANLSQPKTAFCMIAKDKRDAVLQALNSTLGVFDYYILQDTGSTDDTLEVWVEWCKNHKKDCKVSKKYVGKDYKAVEVNGKLILGDFSSPRNDSFRMARECNADYAFWMDSDDVLVNPQGLIEEIKKMHQQNHQLGIMTYIYAKGDGNIKPVVQKRERVIDLSRAGKWFNRVHENYEITEFPISIYEITSSEVQHERTGNDVLETGRRNHYILKQQEEEDGINSFTDKMLQDYAYDHWEHQEYEQAIRLYLLFLERKNIAPENLFHAYTKLSRAYMGLGDFDNALVYANKAITLSDRIADGFLLLGEIYTELKKWDLAILFADKVLQIGKPNTTAPINEFEYIVIPRRIKINALLQKGDINGSIAVLSELLQIMGDENTRNEFMTMNKEKVLRDAIVGISSLLKYYQWTNDQKNLDRLKEAIPLSLLDNGNVRALISEIMHDYKTKTANIKLHGKKSIVIWCGEGVIEPWDGESDITRGIGGSEGMTIQMSRELVKLGNEVVVYNDCGGSSGMTFHGVKYVHASKWSNTLKSDIFISLRRPDAFQQLIKAKRKYLWLHDTDYGEIPLSLMYAPNKIFVLSEAHKAVIKRMHSITDDSIFWITRNGLNALALEYADKNAGKRDPYRVMYASSYDRGLDHLLKMWPNIVKEVPKAHLHICYGWNTYDKLMNARKNTPVGDYMFRQKEYLLKLINETPGVEEEGRISQSQQYKEFKESGIWFYPTEFYEISCITAMFSQALGCIPVCTPHAALIETVNNKYGMKVQLQSIQEAVIYALKNPEIMDSKRDEMMKWAREEYGMEKLAKSWDKFFESDL